MKFKLERIVPLLTDGSKNSIDQAIFLPNKFWNHYRLIMKRWSPEKPRFIPINFFFNAVGDRTIYDSKEICLKLCRKVAKLISVYDFSNVLGGVAAFAASLQVRNGSPLRWSTDKLVRPRGELRRTGTICRCCLHNRRRSSHMCRNVLLAARTAK